MIIERSGAEQDPQLFSVEFELSQVNGVHEVYIAINAIAAQNRLNFANILESGKRLSEPTILAKAVSDLFESNADQFAWAIQRQSRQKSREGLLTESVSVNSTQSQLNFLHHSLIEYRNLTGETVLGEMNSIMGCLAGYTRALEGVAADTMAHVIEDSVEVDEVSSRNKSPIGFGRALLPIEEP